MASSYLVVGAGLVGLATAWKLQRRVPHARVTVLEKEPRVGAHQSTHNSGVLHCGLHYRPGSLKARLAVDGIRQMVAFCRQHGIPHEVCGKVVVAVTPEEIPRLEELMRRGAANGLEGLERLDAAGLRRVEPHAVGLAAARVPQEGIVDYQAVCDTLARLVREGDGRVVTGARVAALDATGDGWAATTGAGEFTADVLVTCAGLHADRVAALAGERRDMRIVAFRGEYYELVPEARSLVRHLIYPVPDPAFPFLGVHFTRLVRGGVECGPNAVLAFAREGYSFGRIDARDLIDALGYAGFWRFLRRHPSMAGRELLRSLSRRRFCLALQRLVPDLRPAHLSRGGAGVRAQAMSPRGELMQDFHVVRRARALHVLNAPSPAATASLAIADHVVDQLAQA
jgi:(S)-2-hydroxyglutarate dehydrogenase